MRKRIVSIVAAVCLLITIIFCIYNRGTVIVENERYKITERGDRWYLRHYAHADITENYGNINVMLAYIPLTFSSVVQLKETVVSGALDQDTLNFFSLYKGKKPVEICNLKHIYKPTLPDGMNWETAELIHIEGMTWEKVALFRDKYVYALSADNGVQAEFSFYTKTQYKSSFKTNYSNFPEDEKIVETSVAEDGSQKYVYYSGDDRMKAVKYELHRADMTFYVKELYGAGSVPTCVYLYGTDGSAYVEIMLEGFSEKPTKQWLSSFGFQQVEDQAG